MRTQFIALLITFVILAFCFSGNAFKHAPIKSRKICDTTYYRGEDPELGDYYLIEEINCDTIEPTDLYPIGGGVGEP